MDITSVRIVDCHVHHWDAVGHRPWYPAMEGAAEDPEGDVLGDHTGGLARRYLQPQFAADTAGLDVAKIVHVAGSSAAEAYLPEARWIGEMAAAGWPAGVIGTFDPDEPLAGIEASLGAQAALPGFRGVRGWFGLDPATPRTKDIFGLFAGTGWVLDLVIRPSDARAFHSVMAATDPSVTFVVEHGGWPESPEVAHRQDWQDAIGLLAELPNAHCKISGFPMVLQSVEATALRPYVEACIDAFGVDRCAIASNFPVDRLFGTYRDLMAAYLDIVGDLGPTAVDQLFATNAERLYRI